MATTRSFHPETISRFRKQRHLLKMSEDDFRDQVVRPVLLRQGLKDGRDLCGPEEEGKDALFVQRNALGDDDVWVIQTKKGALTMAGDANKNVIQAVTQLRTALETKYAFAETKRKVLPSKAVLCASGKINPAARRHIVEELSDPRLAFLDADILINLVDAHFPEFWFGMDADAVPYFRNLRTALEQASEVAGLSDILAASGGGGNAVVDENWVQLYLFRPVAKRVRAKGRVHRDIDFVNIPVTAVTNLPDTEVLVIGDPGVGKSTALRRIAYELSGKAIRESTTKLIPILLRARDLADSEGDLLQVISAQASEVANTGKPVFGPTDLESGKVALLVDALDEVASMEGRQRVLGRLEGVHAAYPKTRIVLTSREGAYLGSLAGLETYMPFRMSDIDLRQAKQIVERVARGRAVPVETREELLRRLQEIHGFQLNPLLVTVFVATSDYSRRDIPANITELFKKFTELMLGRWDATKGFSQQYHAPLKDFLLQRVAYKMHEKRLTSLPLSDFRSIVGEELSSRGLRADARQLIDEILDRSGLLRTSGDAVEFRHHLVQEFFAGRAIQEEAIPGIACDEWWQRPLVFLCGANAEKHSLLSGMCDAIPRAVDKCNFVGAVTVGLALQACYLLPVSQKLEILKWVIDRLSYCGTGLNSGDWVQMGPLFRFLTYYLVGRDAVSVGVLGDESSGQLQTGLDAVEGSPEEKELREYWIIVGMIETGNFERADELIKNFRPNDKRLLLALHLGCYLASEYRVATKEEKRWAKRISDRLAPEITQLREEVLRELTSELLEVQKGQVKALGPAKTGGALSQG